MKQNSFFLDSGAFSAFTKKVEIDIEEYVSFIKRNEKYIDVYSVLDAIGDPEKTLQNQKIMEGAGLKPLPCFHYGEDVKYLKYYLEKHEYIAFGGMVPISTGDLIHWLDYIFASFICDNSGLAKTKVHGFGLTSFKLMQRYPWYSVDSTSWMFHAAMGNILFPIIENGAFQFIKKCNLISISDRSKKNKEFQHFETLSNREKNEIKFYLESIGTNIEDVRDSYFHRYKVNIHYYLEMEKIIEPYNQQKFLKYQKGFFV